MEFLTMIFEMLKVTTGIVGLIVALLICAFLLFTMIIAAISEFTKWRKGQ